MHKPHFNVCVQLQHTIFLPMMLPFNYTSMLTHSGKFLIMPPGRVRPTHMVSTEMEHQSTVLSLSVFPPHYQKVPGDDRYRELGVFQACTARFDCCIYPPIVLCDCCESAWG